MATLACFLAALILAAVALIQSRGQSLPAWATLLIAAGLLGPRWLWL